ncbi:hypothetical protein D8B24_11425 [Verminephrobacter aporrectodeae subsp. tuberculatae]|nr:hypothetical protein [Verminephrobacter aporrectodeae subsp. tuberculatae]
MHEARAWAAHFVHWYNHDHRHSGIRYVSPAQRHAGQESDPGRSARAVRKRSRAQPGTLVRIHAQRVTHRGREPQPRTRLGHQDACGRTGYSAIGCLNKATTILTCAALS